VHGLKPFSPLLIGAVNVTAIKRGLVDGWAKGVAFTTRLGYNKVDWQELKAEVLKRASLYPATLRHTDAFGSRYQQRIILYGKKHKPANALVVWNVNGRSTSLTTLYITEVK